VAAPAPEKKEPEKKEAKPEPKKSSNRFTLQISSFQDRAEAEAFVSKLGPTAAKPYIIKSDVPGKGIFYRVRLGEYASNDEALVAKTEFENAQHIIAYVTKL
jgi:cell division septation protein DedD